MEKKFLVRLRSIFLEPCFVLLHGIGAGHCTCTLLIMCYYCHGFAFMYEERQGQPVAK